MKKYLLLLCLLTAIPMIGQVRFDVARYDGAYETPFHSYSLHVAMDMNGDYREDVVLWEEGKIHILYTDGKSQFTSVDPIPVKEGIKYPLAITVGDITNDGNKEILLFARLNLVMIFGRNEEGRYVLQKELNDISVYPQGVNLVDIDRDGYLDIFICNDIGTSVTYRNNGAYAFERKQMIDFGPDVKEMQEGNYSSIWTDVDGDLDMDLVLAKCSVNADSPEDIRRINRVYINDNGVFREEAAQRGLADGAQSWSIDSGDMDNDGDVDIFYTNHGDDPHVLMYNEQGVFTPSTESFGIGNSQQSYLVDLDNNGYLDILIIESRANRVLFNLDGKRFVEQLLDFRGRRASSISLGDYNNDGFIDLYASFGTYNSVGSEDEVLLNQGNDNSFMSVYLEDEAPVIGSRVTVYNSGKLKMRELKAGYSYCVSNSDMLHFGLGDWTSVDSLRIDWYSGGHRVYRNLDINTQHVFNKNGCHTHRSFKQVQQFLCGDTLELKSDPAHDLEAWNTGSETDILGVQEPGSYYYTYKDDKGCRGSSPNMLVLREEALINKVKEDKVIAVCKGKSHTFSAPEGLEYAWDSAHSGNILEVSESSVWYPSYLSQCSDTLEAGRYELIVVNPEKILADTIKVKKGANARLDTLGEGILWSKSSGGVLTADEVANYKPVKNEVLRYKNTEKGVARTESLGLNIDSVSTRTSEVLNPGIILYSHENLRIKGFRVKSQMAGVRKFLLLDEERNIVQQREIHIEEGVRYVEINFSLSKERTYRLVSDEATNFANLGKRNPLLAFIFSEDPIYPLSTPSGSIDILSSTNGISFYSYFFDIDIETGLYFCQDDLRSVFVQVEGGVSVWDVNKDPIYAYPNPIVNGICKIHGLQENDEVQVSSVLGKPIGFTKEGAGISIDYRGMVVLRVQRGDQVYTELLVVH